MMAEGVGIVAASTASAKRQVLVLGGTGRTGGRVVRQLLERGVLVKAVVRSAARLPEDVTGNPLLAVAEADLLSLTGQELCRHLEGCDAVISCLGHTSSMRSIFGPPYDLVFRAALSVARAIGHMRPTSPVRFVLMGSVSVNRPGRADAVRKYGERSLLWLLRGLVPPARDNQRAADFFAGSVGAGDGSVEWVVVRPDALRDGEVSQYSLSEELVTSLFRPNKTNMANVAHFMCELATDDDTWRQWSGRMPVITNVEAKPSM